MLLVWGALLCVAVLYAAALSYALRTYSRSGLSEYLPERHKRLWLERLDRFDTELNLTAGFMRLASILALLVWIEIAYPIRPDDGIAFWEVARPMGVGMVLLAVFALGIPHAIAVYSGDGFLSANLSVLWGLRFVLYPLTRFLLGVDFVVRRLLGKVEPSEDQQTEEVEREILEVVTEGELRGAVNEEAKEIIESVIGLHNQTVSAIMTPRTDIIAIRADATLEEARQRILEAGHSRIPVYEDTLDHIIGVMYAKDLLRFNPGDPFDVRKIMRTPPYVPESKTLHELLNEFRTNKIQIAIVLDEYGGTAGLATIEDILEELVGEIDDEYDQPEAPAMNVIDEHTVEVDARVHVSEVNEALGVEIPEDGDYETIGGFVFSTLGKIPSRGEHFTHDNLSVTVLDAEPRKIRRLRIQAQPQAESV